MSGQLPTTPGFESVDFSSRDFNVIDVTPTGKTHARNLGGHLWQLTLRYRTLKKTDFAPVMAFIASQFGRLDTFTVVVPSVSSSNGNASGSVTVSGAHAVGDSTILLAGLSGTLKAGDLLKFANHSKVYMITADLTGPGTVSIFPPIIETLANAEAVTYDSVPVTVRLLNDVQDFGIDTAQRYVYEIDCEEAL